MSIFAFFFFGSFWFFGEFFPNGGGEGSAKCPRFLKSHSSQFDRVLGDP